MSAKESTKKAARRLSFLCHEADGPSGCFGFAESISLVTFITLVMRQRRVNNIYSELFWRVAAHSRNDFIPPSLPNTLENAMILLTREKSRSILR